MSEEIVSGNIYAQPDTCHKEGESYIIRSKTGQGWGLPVDNIEPNDLRALADRIERKRA